MANICCDDVYFFSGSNPEGLQDFWHDLEASVVLCHTADMAWIGNLFQYKGMDTSTVRLCGSVSDMERNEDSVFLCLQTKWTPLFDAYTAIAATYDIEFVMLSVENGAHLYYNTDHSGLYFPDQYLVCVGDMDFITPSGIRIEDKMECDEPFASADAVLERFRELGYQADTLESLQLMLSDSDIGIYKFEDPYRT